jgi:putative phosphoesterase
VSDIHCNIRGLELALDAMGPLDDLLCAGDVMYQFRWSNDVAARLRELDAKVVLGNHDEIILGRDGERARSNPTVDQDLVAWLREQPYRRELRYDGKTLLLTHGSPWEPYFQYLYPHESGWSKAASLGVNAVVVWHTHYQMAQKHGDVLVINPGSAGDGRDHRNGFKLSCATWETTTGEVTFYDYDDPTRVTASPAAQR